MNPEWVVIVDPFSTGALLAPEIQALGYACVAVISNDQVSPALRKSFNADDFEHTFHSAEDCQRWVHDSGATIAAVMAGSEVGVALADRLASELGTWGNSVLTTDHRRNKQAMQAALAKHGLAHINTWAVQSDGEARALVQTLDEGAYVLKPANSAATEGVMFADTRAELLERLDDIKWGATNCLGEVVSTYLVQEFLSGPEYVIDMVSVDGDCIISSLAVYDKVHCNGSRFVYNGLHLLNPDDLQYSALTSYARDCAQALGIQVGPIHMEVIDTPRGPIMIEAGARLHGGIAPRLIRDCYSPDLLSLTVDCYLDRTQITHPVQKAEGRIVFVIAHQHGEYPGISASDDAAIRALPSYRGHDIWQAVGSSYEPTTDLLSCPALCWFASDDAEQLSRDEQAFRSIMARYFGDKP